MGGLGVISVLSNIIPKDVHDIVHYYLDGDYSKALDLQLKTLPLTNALFLETNPIPIKAALNMMEFDVGSPRLPLVEISPEGKATLKVELEKWKSEVGNRRSVIVNKI